MHVLERILIQNAEINFFFRSDRISKPRARWWRNGNATQNGGSKVKVSFHRASLYFKYNFFYTVREHTLFMTLQRPPLLSLQHFYKTLEHDFQVAINPKPLKFQMLWVQNKKNKTKKVWFYSSYKETFNRLRVLKTEIEHLQHFLERSKVKLMKDFELWWAEQMAMSQVTLLGCSS